MADTGETLEVIVRRIDGAAVLHGHYRNMGIGRQVASRAGRRQQFPQNLPVTGPRRDHPDGWKRKPFVDVAHCRLDGQWIAEHPAIRADPKKRQNGNPRKSDEICAAELVLQPLLASRMVG